MGTSIVKQTDKRTGITYVFESDHYWDKEKKQTRSKRKLIGKIDPETGEMVPTDGRGKNRKDRTRITLDALGKANAEQYGACYVMDSILETSGILESIRTIFLNHVDEILTIAYFSFMEERPTLAKLNSWTAMHHVPFKKTFTERNLRALCKYVTLEMVEEFIEDLAEMKLMTGAICNEVAEKLMVVTKQKKYCEAFCKLVDLICENFRLSIREKMPDDVSYLDVMDQLDTLCIVNDRGTLFATSGMTEAIKDIFVRLDIEVPKCFTYNE